MRFKPIKLKKVFYVWYSIWLIRDLIKKCFKVNFHVFSEMEKCLLLKIFKMSTKKAKQNEETENFIYEFQ